MQTIWDVIDVRNEGVLAMNVEGTLHARRIRDVFLARGIPAQLRSPRDEHRDVSHAVMPRVTHGITNTAAQERVAWNRLRESWERDAEAMAASERQWSYAIGEGQ